MKTLAITPANASASRNAASVGAGLCPHGFSQMSCSKCGGGGGGGAAPKRTAGLMSWNEAYALWRSIQNARIREEDYLRNREASVRQSAVETNRLLFMQSIGATLMRWVPSAALATMAAVLRAVVLNPITLARNVIASVPAAMSQALQGIKAAVVTVADIADRVATVIGEKLKALQEFLSENLKKLRAQIFKLNILKSLKSIWNFPKAFKEEWLPSAIEKFKRRIFSFLNPVSTEPEYDSDASS